MKLFVEVFGAALAISCLEGMNDNGLVTVFGTCTTSDACYTLDTTGVDSTLYDVNNLITFGCDDSDILYDAWVYASSFGLIDESGCDVNGFCAQFCYEDMCNDVTKLSDTKTTKAEEATTTDSVVTEAFTEAEVKLVL